jgi:hypothetical protein
MNSSGMGRILTCALAFRLKAEAQNSSAQSFERAWLPGSAGRLSLGGSHNSRARVASGFSARRQLVMMAPECAPDPL